MKKLIPATILRTKIVVVAEFATLVNARGAGIVDVANRLSKLFP